MFTPRWWLSAAGAPHKSHVMGAVWGDNYQEEGHRWGLFRSDEPKGVLLMAAASFAAQWWKHFFILFSHIDHGGALLPVSPRFLARHSLERWCCSEAGTLLLTKTGRMYFFNPKSRMSYPVTQGQQSSLVLRWGQCCLSAADLNELTTLKKMQNDSCGSRAMNESGVSPLLESGACRCWQSP